MPKPWSLARMARYVQKCKYLQQLKDNEEVCSNGLEKGSFLLFCRDRPFLAPKESGNRFQNVINWRSFKDVEAYNPEVKESSVVLDVDEDDLTPFFACSINPESEEIVQEKYKGHFTDMRKAIFSLSDSQNQLVSRGYSLVTWNASVKFCSYCGSSLDRKISGCSKVCSKKCDTHKMTHYPQIHPVAIIRVLNSSEDKILLVRQPRHPKGMYSCIAGFMEPGEVLQDNVMREIAEEVSIVVDKSSVKYFQSEAWPLPQTSLMLACTAIALEGSDKIEIDKSELEDAKWFTKEEIGEAYRRLKENPTLYRNNEQGLLIFPPRGAIAHQLIRNWLEKYTPQKL